jgi:hypothetical protein
VVAEPGFARDGDGPCVRFYRVIESTLGPLKADKSAMGTLPTAAFQYCEAIRLASSFGWYIFSPMSFYLRWDGTDIFWTHEGIEGGTWLPLQSEQFPGLPAQFDANAPDFAKGYAPPFLSRTFQQTGVVQLWSGLFMRTAPGWSTLIRPLANLPRSHMYECYEGVIETDRWFGPLFVNLRLTAINQPIHIPMEFPIFQVQSLPRALFGEGAQQKMEVIDRLADLSAADWKGYHETVVRRVVDKDYRPGEYGAEIRKRDRSQPDD